MVYASPVTPACLKPPSNYCLSPRGKSKQPWSSFLVAMKKCQPRAFLFGMGHHCCIGRVNNCGGPLLFFSNASPFPATQLEFE